jgi:hypothetical protein
MPTETTTFEISDTMRKVIDGKNALATIATNKAESDLMRRFARAGLSSLNNVIAQALAEQS